MMKYYKKMEPFVKDTAAIVQGKGSGSHLIESCSTLSKEQISKGISHIKIKEYWPKVFMSSELAAITSKDDKIIIDSIKHFAMGAEKNKKSGKLHL
jgi:hypothetical protein